MLFTVATPQGVNPSTLAQGEKTTGKIYFDVTGEKPDSVFYSDGGPDQVVLWVEPPPPPPAPATGGYRAPASSGSSSSGAAETATPAADAAEPEGRDDARTNAAGDVTGTRRKDAVQQMLRRACARAGVKYRPFYTFRHTFRSVADAVKDVMPRP